MKSAGKLLLARIYEFLGDLNWLGDHIICQNITGNRERNYHLFWI